MRPYLTIVNLLLAALSWGQSESNISMFYPGDLLGEVDTPLCNSNFSYYGIYKLDDKSECSFIVLDFLCKDTIIEEPAYGLSRVLSIDSVRPLFIVSGVEGMVNNTKIPGMNLNGLQVVPGNSASFDIRNKGYAVFATGNYVEDGKGRISSIADYKVIVKSTENGKITQQILYEADTVYAWSGGGFEGGVRLRWMGDLDNDDGLDIILTTSADYRSWDVILLMSSKLSDKIVIEVLRYSGSAP